MSKQNQSRPSVLAIAIPGKLTSAQKKELLTNVRKVLNGEEVAASRGWSVCGNMGPVSVCYGN
jgi:hypothetical protein